MTSAPERRPGRIRRDLKRCLLDPITDQLTHGLSPDAVALTLALGLCLAVVPVVGVTTILCFLAALAFRLNQPLMMGVNYLSGPLQLVLLVPFLKLGRLLFGGAERTPRLSEMASLVVHSPLRAIETFWGATLHGVVAWLLVCPFLFAALYLGLRPALRAAAARLRGRTPAEPAQRQDPGLVAAEPALAPAPTRPRRRRAWSLRGCGSPAGERSWPSA